MDKTLTASTAIKLILNSTRPSELFGPDWLNDYKFLIRLVHPDRCNEPLAPQASSKLGEYKMLKENGEKFVDDSGEFTVFDDSVFWSNNEPIQVKAYDVFHDLTNRTDSAAKTFRDYLPITSDYNITTHKRGVRFKHRTIPIIGLTIEQEHVNWIISRLFELITWYDSIDLCSVTILPETIFIVPETHGIIHVSNYHATKIGSRVESISAKYRGWYPRNLFITKRASRTLDLEMVKRLAAYLLGDKSGNGTILKMKKNVNDEYVNFLLSSHKSTYTAWQEYRKMLHNNFDTKKFLPCNL